MTDQELFKQALEALERVQAVCRLESDDDYCEGAWELHNNARAALRERLEQPQQEPVAWMDGYRNLYSLEEKAAGCEDAAIPLYTTPPRREQEEPVVEEPYLNKAYRLAEELRSHLLVVPAPQRREWVGLTEGEIKKLCDENFIAFGAYAVDFISAIEAKLKEKNG